MMPRKTLSENLAKEQIGGLASLGKINPQPAPRARLQRTMSSTTMKRTTQTRHRDDDKENQFDTSFEYEFIDDSSDTYSLVSEHRQQTSGGMARPLAGRNHPALVTAKAPRSLDSKPPPPKKESHPCVVRLRTSVQEDLIDGMKGLVLALHMSEITQDEYDKEIQIVWTVWSSMNLDLKEYGAILDSIQTNAAKIKKLAVDHQGFDDLGEFRDDDSVISSWSIATKHHESQPETITNGFDDRGEFCDDDSMVTLETSANASVARSIKVKQSNSSHGRKHRQRYPNSTRSVVSSVAPIPEDSALLDVSLKQRRPMLSNSPDNDGNSVVSAVSAITLEGFEDGHGHAIRGQYRNSPSRPRQLNSSFETPRRDNRSQVPTDTLCLFGYPIDRLFKFLMPRDSLETDNNAKCFDLMLELYKRSKQEEERPGSFPACKMTTISPYIQLDILYGALLRKQSYDDGKLKKALDRVDLADRGKEKIRVTDLNTLIKGKRPIHGRLTLKRQIDDLRTQWEQVKDTPWHPHVFLPEDADMLAEVKQIKERTSRMLNRVA